MLKVARAFHRMCCETGVAGEDVCGAGGGGGREEWRVVSESVNSAILESLTHSALLLSGLSALRAKGHLLDVTLVTQGGQTFQAHKVVLASCSDYFRAMFTTEGMLESRQSEICLNGVSAVGMQLLLDFAYTCRLSLDLANVQDVLSAASHLQLVQVVQACSNFLQSQLDLDNCVDIALISETYSLKGLRTVVLRYICSQLVELSRSAEFCRLRPAQLEEVLGSDFPVDCPEAQVLDLTLSYLSSVQLSDQQRAMWTSRLLRKIQLSEVSWWEMERLIQREDLHTGRLLVSEAVRQWPLPAISCPALSHQLINSRGMTLSIVKVGGFSLGGVTNEITYLQSKTGKWRHLTKIPHVEQSSYGTAVLNNELYVVGGCYNQGLQEMLHPFGFRYSARLGRWSTLAPMQRERCRFSLNVLGESLYAVGGKSDSRLLTDSERYNPREDRWERIAPLPAPSTLHAGASLGGYLYISGGLDRNFYPSHTLLRYDRDADRWERLAPLLSPRADHTMFAFRGALYVCGGWLEEELTSNRVLVEWIDRYEPEEDRWTRVSRLPSPRFHAGITPLSSKIYFIGGFQSHPLFDSATLSWSGSTPHPPLSAVDVFDLDTETWSTEDQYPQDIWEHTCATLFVPTLRDDVEVTSPV